MIVLPRRSEGEDQKKWPTQYFLTLCSAKRLGVLCGDIYFLARSCASNVSKLYVYKAKLKIALFTLLFSFTPHFVLFVHYAFK